MPEDEQDEDREELFENLQYGEYPKEEEKHNIFTFFKKVILMKDTTRVANLKDDEIGLAKVPVRTLQGLSLYCKEVGLSGLGRYFEKEAHILTDTSLGREGFIPKLAVTTKREMEAKSKVFSDAQKKTWFKKKDSREGFGQQSIWFVERR